MRASRGLLLSLFAGAFAAFQLATLSRPVPDFDEATIADYALHQRFALTDGLLPENLKHLSHRFMMGIWAGFEGILRLSMKTLGIGLWQIRLAPLIAALAGTVVFGLLLLEAVPLPVTVLTLIAWATSYDFFALGHAARPESFIYLTMMLHFYGLWRGGSRSIWLGLGCLAGLMLSFHPAIIFLFGAVLIFAAASKNARPAPPLAWTWWAVGVGIGAMWSLCLLDFDNIFLSFQFMKGVGYSAPPLLRWWRAPWMILLNGIAHVITTRVATSPFRIMSAGALLTAAAWQIRRWRALPASETYLLAIALVMTTLRALADAGGSVRYVAYIEPWLLLQFIWVLYKLAAQQMSLDIMDVLLLTVIEVVTIGAYHASYLFRTVFPAFTVLVIAFPWAILRLRRRALGLWMAVYLGAIGSCDLALQWTFIASDVTHHPSAQQLDTWRQKVGAQSKIVGPSALWLYFPDWQFQALETLDFAGRHIRGFDSIAALERYHPTLVLWPQGESEAFRASLAKKNLSPVLGDVWQTPWGDYREVRFGG